MAETTHENESVGLVEGQVKLEDMYEVILHNDDVNVVEHVILSLMRVFQHSQELALKITSEAHNRGQAIAEVEAETMARQHREQLQSLGLIATMRKV